jgi:drug/metabolite transporter (DMT)-like permease
MAVLNIKNPNFPPIVAGVLFGLSLILFVDGIVQANQEADKENHFSFVMCIPAIFSTIGLLLLHLVSPTEVKEGDGRGGVVLFTAWLAMFGSTVGALAIVFFFFTGKQSRTHAAPGVSLVLYTCLAPIVSSILWWGRRVTESDTW